MIMSTDNLIMSNDNCDPTFLRGIGNMRRLSLKLSSKRYLALVSLAGGGEGAIDDISYIVIYYSGKITYGPGPLDLFNSV